MIRTVEAIIDENGAVRLRQEVRLAGTHRAILVILEDEPIEGASETAVLSEAALSEDWSRPEEEEAWKFLKGVR